MSRPASGFEAVPLVIYMLIEGPEFTLSGVHFSLCHACRVLSQVQNVLHRRKFEISMLAILLTESRAPAT